MKSVVLDTNMVRAILDGHKTVMRRAIKLYPEMDELWYNIEGEWFNSDGEIYHREYQVGDILWVREKTYGKPGGADNQDLCYATHCPCGLSDEEHAKVIGWTPPIHMPREAARIFLRVADVRKEPLQDITEDDVLKEGCGLSSWDNSGDFPRTAGFAQLWDELYARQGFAWNTNPFVWVIEFERVEEKR